MRIIMLGAPGAGKGTQAKKIAAKYQIPHISTGDIFRANIKNGTELGKKAKTYMDQGLLVPDELTCDLVVDRIQQPDAANGYVLDGFPRTINQAEALQKGLEERGLKLDKVINIDVDKNILVKRLSGRRVCKNCGETYHIDNKPTLKDGVCDKCSGEVIQRADDNEKTVLDRIEVYEKQTFPLIDFYKNLGIVLTVDGTLSIEDVFSQIKESLSKNV